MTPDASWPGMIIVMRTQFKLVTYSKSSTVNSPSRNLGWFVEFLASSCKISDMLTILTTLIIEDIMGHGFWLDANLALPNIYAPITNLLKFCMASFCIIWLAQIASFDNSIAGNFRIGILLHFFSKLLRNSLFIRIWRHFFVNIPNHPFFCLGKMAKLKF